MLDIEGNLTVLLKSAFTRVTTEIATSGLGRLPLLVAHPGAYYSVPTKSYSAWAKLLVSCNKLQAASHKRLDNRLIVG